MRPKLGVIGAGFVGGAIARGFSLTSDVRIFDKDPKRAIHTFGQTCQQDYVFLCLPTPMVRVDGGEADLSILRLVCKQIKEAGHDPLVIIKSTIPIGTTDQLCEQFGLRIIHNPEFLTARNADIDFLTPARTILGGTKELTSQVATIFADRFPGNNILEMTARESEAVKYIANCFFAVKVLYFNEVFLGLNSFGLDWKKVMAGVLSDGRIGISHCDVPGHDGKHGFSGACVLPEAQVRVSFRNKKMAENIASFSGVKRSGKSFISAECSIRDFERLFSENDVWEIESVDANMERGHFKKVIKVTSREADEELYEFHTSSGIFTCTGDHLMPVMREGDQILITAKEIKESDKLFSK